MYLCKDGSFSEFPPESKISGTGLENSKRGNTGAGWFQTADGRRFYLRSTWELKYAKYLDFLKGKSLIKDWTYEPETFWFEGIRRGTNNYKPDFRTEMNDGTVIYVEVKGFWDKKSLTKMKRMAKYHPEVQIKKVDKEWFSKMNPKMKGVIW